MIFAFMDLMELRNIYDINVLNSFMQVLDDDHSSAGAALRNRLNADDPDLTRDERLQIRQYLEAYPDEE